MITFSTAYDYFNDLALEHANDPVERVRYAGYAVLMHDMLMYPLVPPNDEYIRRIWRLEGLIRPTSLTPRRMFG